MSDDLKKKISGLQSSPDGRWFHEGQREFYELAEFLLSKGLSEEEVYEVLGKAYRTVSNEYGD